LKPGDRVKVKPRNEWGSIDPWPSAHIIKQYTRDIGKTGEVIRIEAHVYTPEFNVVVRLEDASDELWFHPAMLEKVEPEKRPLGFKLS